MNSAKRHFPIGIYILFGVLCLIPLLGALAGIGLLVTGIFIYRNNVFIILGSCGILFTIFIYGSLFYTMQHGELFSKGKEQLARMQLNNIVKDVEFYKLVNNSYPDSLEQLKEIDTVNTSMIYDNLSKESLVSNMETFHYSKKDSGYTLFSIGIDREPFTKDDIYPAFNNTILRKTGLIKK